jgi:hypothetical protein
MLLVCCEYKGVKTVRMRGMRRMRIRGPMTPDRYPPLLPYCLQLPTSPPMTVSSYARLLLLTLSSYSFSLSLQLPAAPADCVEVPTDECVEVGRMSVWR